MLDIGHDFKQIDPDWSDTLRVTKLPSFENQFGRDNSTFAGVRQSRLGVRSSTPTTLGELRPRSSSSSLAPEWTQVKRRFVSGTRTASWENSGRPDVEPVHGSGCLSELPLVLGTNRNGLLPQRAGALDAATGRS